MCNNLVSEYSCRIRIRVIHTLSILVLSFVIMFMLYENFYLNSLNPVMVYSDLFYLLPFVSFLIFKGSFFNYNWIIKLYLILSMLSFLFGSLYAEKISHTLFPILFPLCVVMYLNDRKALFHGVFIVLAFAVMISKSVMLSRLSLRLLLNFISVTGITALSLVIEYNIERIQKKVTFIKYADHKTNLPNRDKFIADLQQSPLNNIVAILNIDGFKHINDLYGHYIGDELIIAIGKRLCELYPEWQIYRLSGSEFGLLNFYQEESPEEWSAQLIDVFLENNNSLIEIEGIELHGCLSMGGSVEGWEGTSRKNCLVHTDIALQEAKRKRSKVYFYKKDNTTKNKISESHHWERKIIEAFKFDRVCSYYQPILCNRTGVIKKYECLARFVDEDGTVHSPHVFMPYLSSTHYYSKLTRTMVNKSFATLKNTYCDLSINLSVEDLTDPFTMQYIMLMLKNNHSLSHRIQFEILETTQISDIVRVKSVFNELKRYNCRIALDDFGSGYSNFEYLIDLNIDCIKIDGSLIQNVCRDKTAYNMVKNIVFFCKDLKVDIIAEYVSNREIYKKVLEMGIDYSQGYYIGKPRDKSSLLSAAADPEQMIKVLEA